MAKVIASVKNRTNRLEQSDMPENSAMKLLPES